MPKTQEHSFAEMRLEREAGTVVTDIAMAELHALTPAYGAALSEAAREARAVVACHPYPLPAIRSVSEAPIWYEAQDVEAALKRHVLGESPTARRLLEVTEQVERACYGTAELVWACSSEDRDELLARYGGDADRVWVVPNGVALEEAVYVGPEERAARRTRLRVGARTQAVFVASWHEPNVVAARAILAAARQTPEADFTILGSVGDALRSDPRPDNVMVTGTVGLAFKQDLLGTASLALNPVTTGSGTNLKMADYFSAGVPVLSSAFGARGLGVRPDEHYLPAEPAALGRRLAAWDPGATRTAAIVRAAREHVERTLSWAAIGAALRDRLAERG